MAEPKNPGGTKRTELPFRSIITGAIIGGKGAGKTVLSAGLLMELLKSGRDVIVFDPIGAVSRLFTRGDINGVKIDPEGKVNIIDVDRTIKDHKQALNVIKTVLKPRRINIFNFSQLLPDEIIVTANNLCKVLRTLSEFALVVDEVGEFCPQNPRGAYCMELERLNRVGRNTDIQPIIVTTQRPQQTNKNVLALADSWFTMKIGYYLDANIVGQNVGVTQNGLKNMKRNLKTLKPGEFYFIEDGEVTRGGFDLNKMQIFGLSGGRPVGWFE